VTEEPAIELRRILVVLDAASPSSRLLETGIALAKHAHAELTALFVEDEDLLRLAALPFGRQYSPIGAEASAVDLSSMERELARLASLARRRLAEAASRAKVPASFRVARGAFPDEVASTLSEMASDLVILDARARPLGHFRIYTPGYRLALGLRRTVLLAQPRSELPGRLIAVTNGGPSGARTREFAQYLAASLGRELEILPLPEAGREGEAAVQGGPQHRAISRGVGKLRSSLRGASSALVIIAGDSPLLGQPALRLIVDEIGCSLLIIS